MPDLYVLVHVDETTTGKDPVVNAEIERIRTEETFVEVTENPCVVEYKVPKDARLLVCGAYHGRKEWDHRCVDEHMKALRRAGQSPELYRPATVTLDL